MNVSRPDAHTLREHLTAPNDLGLARAFAAYYAGRIAWSEQREIWRIAQSPLWSEDEQREIHRIAAEFSDELGHAYMAMDLDEQKAWRQLVEKSRSFGGRNTLIADAKAFMTTPEAAYDSDDLALLTPDGPISLAGYETAIAAERFTKATQARLNHPSDAWLRFVELVLPNPEVRDYVRRCFGSGLSGVPGQRLIFAVYGPAGSGKSTFTCIIAAAMGGYACTVNPMALTLQQRGSSSGHTSELIPLVGARMAFVHEIPEGVTLNAALLKTIVGGEETSVAEKGHPYFTTRFRAKVYAVSNFPLTLPATDKAAWARLNLVPFLTPIVNPDRNAFARLLSDQAVRDGALTWLLDGWRDFSGRGYSLDPPTSVMALQSEQQSDNLWVADWLDECVELGEGFEMGGAEAYDSCIAYLGAGARGLDRRRFARELEVAGLTKFRGKTTAWIGARLRGYSGSTI